MTPFWFTRGACRSVTSNQELVVLYQLCFAMRVEDIWNNASRFRRRGCSNQRDESKSISL